MAPRKQDPRISPQTEAVVAERCAQLLGARMKQIRLSIGVTQQQLADRIGSHRSIIARTERGRHVQKLTTVLSWAQALDVLPSHLHCVLDQAMTDQTREAESER